MSRGGALHSKGERNSRVGPPFPQSPRCLSLFQGNLFSLHCLDFQAEDRLTPRCHLGQPSGKASCESLMGKPRAKVTDPLIHAKGSETLCYSSGGKRPCMTHSRRGLTSLGRLQKYPKIHVCTGEESSGSGTEPHKVLCRGLAPVDPGNSKGERRWRERLVYLLM